MNKTIIININGFVFHIEEDAYEILKNYMTEVKRHFAYSADSDEIVTDIENRLAEMFNERLADHKKQVIVVQDVEEILAVMGSVNDFELPEEESNYAGAEIKSERKFFRDPDDKIIGGVCSGLGHYFDIETKWMRVIAVILTAISGIGLFIYIILWLVLPPAITRQEKMAMKGEPINLQNFKKSFDEEVDSLRQNFNKSQPYIDRTGEALTGIVKLIGRIVKVFVKIIGGIIIITGVIGLVALIATLLFTVGFWNSNQQPFPLNAINPEFQSPLYLAAFLLLVIPLIALILFAVRVIFNRKIVTKTGSFAMLILWLTGLGMGIFYGIKMASEFKEDARFEQQTELPPYSTLYLKLNPNKPLSKDDSLRFNIDPDSFQGRILNDEDENDLGELTEFDLYIEKSEDNKTSLTKKFSARGKDFESALKAAQRTQYRFQQTDSTLTFDKYLYLTGNGIYRKQRVNVTLKVPLNTHLIIDGNLNEHLHRVNLWYCQPEDSSYKTPSEWIMTEEGLKCANDSLYQKKQNL